MFLKPEQAYRKINMIGINPMGTHDIVTVVIKGSFNLSFLFCNRQIYWYRK